MKQLLEITIEITVGEYQHNVYEYFYGTLEEAQVYADNYMKTIFGEGTTYDKLDDIYYNNTQEYAAALYSIGPFNAVHAVGNDGAHSFRLVPESKFKNTSSFLINSSYWFLGRLCVELVGLVGPWFSFGIHVSLKPAYIDFHLGWVILCIEGRERGLYHQEGDDAYNEYMEEK